ncbi:hypothetical protein LINPERHAP1_LOCUS15819 [Linum perenne]
MPPPDEHARRTSFPEEDGSGGEGERLGRNGAAARRDGSGGDGTAVTRTRTAARPTRRRRQDAGVVMARRRRPKMSRNRGPFQRKRSQQE